MADGLITAPAPKVATAEFKPELALILRLQTVASSVWAKQRKRATHNPVRVRNVGANVSCAL